MHKWMIISLVVILALGLGVGLAFMVNAIHPVGAIKTNQATNTNIPQFDFRQGPMMPMDPWGQQWKPQSRPKFSQPDQNSQGQSNKNLY